MAEAHFTPQVYRAHAVLRAAKDLGEPVLDQAVRELLTKELERKGYVVFRVERELVKTKTIWSTNEGAITAPFWSYTAWGAGLEAVNEEPAHG
jgi:hypothetical protein